MMKEHTYSRICQTPVFVTIVRQRFSLIKK